MPITEIEYCKYALIDNYVVYFRKSSSLFKTIVSLFWLGKLKIEISRKHSIIQWIKCTSMNIKKNYTYRIYEK